MIRSTLGRITEAVGAMLLRKVTKRALPRSVSEWRYLECSFSQFAEDLLVLQALEQTGRTEKAYYVDVGAFDPLAYSNTVRLRWRGWRGINIDAQLDHVARFKVERPEDANLHFAVSEKSGTAEFLCYDSGTTGRLAVNDETGSKSILGENVRKVIQVPTETLALILSKHAPTDLPFGFLSIDCEGAELGVLRSNDWAKYRPWIMAVEDHAKYQETEIDRFCSDQGYELFAMAHVTKIFVDKKQN